MPTQAHQHHRSRSSIDRVFELLADLEENQIANLLEDLNHTTKSNVPVSQAIALFEHGPTKPNKKYERSSSPVRTLQAELERRHSKRLSSAPEPRQQQRSKRASLLQHQQQQQQSTFTFPAVSTDGSSDISSDFVRPASPASPPNPRDVERPRSASGPTPEFRARSYKRISRPTLLSPTATAELHELLLAYFNEAPSSTASTATPSPTTPSTGFSHSLFSFGYEEPEPNVPGLDLLEPSPTRTPQPFFGFGGSGGLKPKPSMSSIFEVMGSR
ncbi:hypothetical protein QBC35DRAFT_390075 [Podospora australis]|uniref:Uncharacterized protein n=1 Tax=Podospora australis TaxID=1536484 RepID=A0AAN7AGR2_9PEZI|nr:hypothetical protein QBC35DRAFT_390075 [Podospora australis]